MIKDLGRGFAVRCDESGVVRELIRDDMELLTHIRAGESAARIADTASAGKVIAMFDEIRQNGLAYDWEINVPMAGGVRTLHCSGVAADGDVVLIGAESGSGAIKLFDEILAINNEQTNHVRTLLKERSEVTLDSLSRLNNELVTLQRELNRKNAELARLNKTKDHFIGMAAHDLRNPLNAIMTFSQLMLTDLAEGRITEFGEFLELIHNSSSFMLRLVNDMLDVAKIESGHLELAVEMVDLSHLIRDCVALNGLLALRKQSTIEFTAADVPSIPMDSPKIQQVMDNLLSNAIKYSPPGAVVSVHLDHNDEKAIVSVTDTGPGIPEGERDRLFKPFSRTSVKSTGGESSTGLGLVIVRRIVQGHGGEICVESEVGRGSTFTFTLPLKGPPGTNS